MGELEHSSSSKRRRLENGYAEASSSPSPSPVGSSSDELAGASPDHAGWNKTYARRRSYKPSRSFSGSVSEDELAVMDDGEASYWREEGEAPNGRASLSRDESRGRRSESEMIEQHRLGGSTPIPAEEMTPVASPPPPRPKPERLNYRQKSILRGHLRGVSAVQFSRDGSMIASGGMKYVYIAPPCKSVIDRIIHRCGWNRQSLGYSFREAYTYIRRTSSRDIVDFVESGWSDHSVGIR